MTLAVPVLPRGVAIEGARHGIPANATMNGRPVDIAAAAVLCSPAPAASPALSSM